MSVVHERSNVVLRTPAEFAAAIPALLGFSPEASLVAVFLGEGRVIVTMRVDLPEDLEDFTEHATGVACRVGADAVVVAAQHVGRRKDNSTRRSPTCRYTSTSQGAFAPTLCFRSWSPFERVATLLGASLR